MPEGDTIHAAARRVGAALVGRPIESIEAPQPRHALDRWPERLAGRGVRAVDARGKHLFLRFDGDLTLHSHLRMGGWWGVFRRGERWRRSPRRAWLVIRTPEHEVVQFDGPVLELMTDGRSRFDQRIANLGPDVLAGDFDDNEFLHRLRADDPTRGIGDALLDQRIVAGIGNMWKAKACFAAGLDPWRRSANVTDDEALAVVAAARSLMQASLERGARGLGRRARVFALRPAEPGAAQARAGRPCPRCGTLVRARGQGDDNRTTFWCPGCQS
jgi:endonuclease-8